MTLTATETCLELRPKMMESYLNGRTNIHFVNCKNILRFKFQIETCELLSNIYNKVTALKRLD